jgi:acetolactate synthase I/III small subunit
MHHREMTEAEAASFNGYSTSLDGSTGPMDEIVEESIKAQEEQARRTRETLRHDFHPRQLPVSQALRHKHEHLEAITHLTHQFGGKVLDISNNNCIVELSAKPTRIDAFLKLIQPFGILESARTGGS